MKGDVSNGEKRKERQAKADSVVSVLLYVHRNHEAY